MSGPWIVNHIPGVPNKRYKLKWEASNWDEDEDDGEEREEWFVELDEALARTRELLSWTDE